MPHKTTPHRIIPYGDSAFLIEFDTEQYEEKVTDYIHTLIRYLRNNHDWEELVPGYNSLLAYFCPHHFNPNDALTILKKSLQKVTNIAAMIGDIIEIPVCYGGIFGPDMSTIIDSSGLSENQIIKRHSEPIYKVCMMGFIPGFTFLSEAPQALHHPRRKTPRNDIKAGSVGIAGWQTGIYGLDSPGGWQLIGRTPLTMFDPLRRTPFLLKAGDSVKFVPMAHNKFSQLDQQANHD